jgi:hypothetical protein
VGVPCPAASSATYWTVLNDDLEVVTEQLRQRVAALKQQTVDLRQQLSDRTEELDAARTANRELMAKLNRPAPSHPSPRR